MSRHQLLTRLAKYFQVVWVNPSRTWRQILRRHDDFTTGLDSTPSFSVYDPQFLFRFYRPKWLGDRIESRRLQNARNVLIHKGCEKIVLYFWRPEFARALDLLSYELSCYHIVDEYSFCENEQPLLEEERNLINRVDQVFVSSPGLFDKKGRLNPNTDIVPNGVDYKSFSESAVEPVDLQGVPHPRVGYVGFLKKMLDWELLAYLSGKHTSWSFVLVGGALNHAEVIAGMKALSMRPNVYFLGAKLTRDLSSYPQHFDVCIMPYRTTGYSNYVYPLKLHEYLASGRPVVGSQIRTLDNHKNVISLAGSFEEWSAALAKALEEPDNNKRQRQAVAQTHDWDLLSEKVARILGRHLGITMDDPRVKGPEYEDVGVL